jgi:hypothetical protein
MIIQVEFDDMLSDDITICHEGKVCMYKYFIKAKKAYMNYCTSAVPCKTATEHKLILLKQKI